jgi:hypothetical protein
MRDEDVCLTCGQCDDHPKLHYAEETYHHDCLPPRVRLDVSSGSSGAEVLNIVEACEGGLKGDDLCAYIEETFSVAEIEG